jgi:hypothetical protein
MGITWHCVARLAVISPGQGTIIPRELTPKTDPFRSHGSIPTPERKAMSNLVQEASISPSTMKRSMKLIDPSTRVLVLGRTPSL